MELHGNNPKEVIEAIQDRGRKWSDGRRSPDGKTIGLVIEGGAMRGVRSAGGLLALEAMGLTHVFDHVYGCSAGAVNACYFLADQGAFGTTIYYQNINNKNFINFRRLRKMVDVDFVFDHVCVNEKPLLISNVMSSQSRLFVAVTDVESGEGRCIDAKATSTPLLTLLKASSAMPVVYNEPVLVDGRRCIDGGVANSIPLSHAIANGCTHLLVLLTRPSSYRNPDASWMEKMLFARTSGRNNDVLCKTHLLGDGDTNKMRDIAFGVAPCESLVSIATLAPGPTDAPVDRSTVDERLLKKGAIEFANRTFRVFGAEFDQMVEVLQPFTRGETAPVFRSRSASSTVSPGAGVPQAVASGETR